MVARARTFPVGGIGFLAVPDEAKEQASQNRIPKVNENALAPTTVRFESAIQNVKH